MANSQKGYTILEAIAYLAIYGVISVAVLAGASAILKSVNQQRDLAAIVQLEKDIRSSASILNNYSTKNTTTFNRKGSDLQKFLQAYGIENSKQLPSGREILISGPGYVGLSFTGKNNDNTTFNSDCYPIAYSFSFEMSKMVVSEAADYWNYSWPDSVILMEIGNTGRHSEYSIDPLTCKIQSNDPDFVENFTSQGASSSNDFYIRLFFK